MKIGVDVDGVLADFVTAYNEVILKHTSIIIPPPSDSYPDVWEYDVAAGLTPEQLKTIWADIIKRPHFWGMLHALPGVPNALWKLSRLREEHDIYFITSRPGARAKYYTEMWLAWHGFDKATVIITGKAKDKGLIAQGLGLDIFIEDNATNLATVMDHVPELEGYLIDKPYNRGEEQRGLVECTYYRVASVGEAIDQIFEMRLREAA